MYAVFATGGRQVKAAPEQTVQVDYLPDAGEGQKILFDKVLLVSDDHGVRIGAPYLEGAVHATVVAHTRDKKVLVYKKKRRVDYHKKHGHRQDYTTVRIDSIEA
ncbi:50S ribosomal protein L21 [bacterium]|nr:50S ribosomal protein L21 [bacterium]MBU1983160.1 50S ribosomal protein L21 [bacterium]